MRWGRSALVLFVLMGMIFLQVAGWVAGAISERAAPEEATPNPTKTLVPTYTPTPIGGSRHPDVLVAGPPPPGTVLIRLEIPKIGFVSSVFPVGLEQTEEGVVTTEPAMDTVWGLDLSNPLVQAYGWGGRNYVVWAHRADWASRWPELGIGDKILFFTINHSEERGFYEVSYEAQVVSWRIIPVEVETNFYQASETPVITLVTCHPENDPDPQFRLVIRALFSSALTD
ncbi:hypothetical protein COT70_00230 [candidate division WWE3 bacterium CG09_land_8_20_14_0_10_47_33]|uniref:Sortase n=1 Tax=candidate division WWE3 bacterium CG_4_9_14_0_2_um_filter_48_10 TaxID=1975078 RepID=A0A2M8EIJ5_UNCKA|nr:MAG: hypothetical protein COT70_00230 [candidate division WWE3 bacterium CG09_land_8_20_14_0_10_47_33]PIZ41566.1 MAG: hypothetical protein COY35_00115 [candidate division WWE3 bacterium CG_4_10_14_0_2_um_filter_47_8]PJC22512.1 MAG: hypothetical protein CO059_02330 [candidate division WWE3 bacterium CG_4_9_14_0_2_um_filter_48_10]PJE52302.1 MAG: hypothetical protein COV28_00305 [candidate division WWE3 bacterium CG10_big_fil_rev_8_21_14_0_10_48_23]